MPRRVEIEAEATAEAIEARIWYAARDTDLAVEFMRELDRAVEVIADRPDRWPADRRDTRKYHLRRFPFRVVYLFDPQRVRIIAIAHDRRKPEYWKDRI
jgi:toxin ParE1/3/4